MSNGWLDGMDDIPVRQVDLSDARGNGPFHADGREYLGWILHVNVGTTAVDLFTAGEDRNPHLVTPTIQVYQSAADGGVVQFLPIDWQPWCQIEGNFHYGAAETAGFPDDALTEFQLDALAYFHAESHRLMGVDHAVADSPGERGIGTHEMGGAAWGGHACPGSTRQDQRAEIIRRAQILLDPTLEDDGMTNITPAEFATLLRDPAVMDAIGDAVEPRIRERLRDFSNGHELQTVLGTMRTNLADDLAKAVAAAK